MTIYICFNYHSTSLGSMSVEKNPFYSQNQAYSHFKWATLRLLPKQLANY